MSKKIPTPEVTPADLKARYIAFAGIVNNVKLSNAEVCAELQKLEELYKNITNPNRLTARMRKWHAVREKNGWADTPQLLYPRSKLTPQLIERAQKNDAEARKVLKELLPDADPAKKVKEETVHLYREILKIWNDTASYPDDAAVARRLDMNLGDLSKQIIALREFANHNPQLKLPALVRRRFTPRGVMALAPVADDYIERVSIDRDKLANADVLIVSTTQLGAPSVHVFDLMMRSVEGYYRQQGRRAKIVYLPLVFGRISDGRGRLRGHFPLEHEGHILLDDFYWKNRVMLRGSFRILPTMMGKLLSDGVVQSVMRHPADIQVFPGPRRESKHVARAGGVMLGDRYPVHLLVAGGAVQPHYPIDGLGLASRQGQVALEEHVFQCHVIEQGTDGLCFTQTMTALRKRSADGRLSLREVHPWMYGTDYRQGKVIKFTPEGWEDGGRPDLSAPDWHAGFTAPFVDEAYYGDGGIVPALNPGHVLEHDHFNGHSISPFFDPIQQEVLMAMADNPRLAELMGVPRVGDQLRVRHEFELNRDIVLRKLRCTSAGTRFVWVASNHPLWVMRNARSLNWIKDPVNRRDMRKLYDHMEDYALDHATNPALFGTLDPVHFEMRRLLAEADPKAAERVTFLNENDQFFLPEDVNAVRRVNAGVHGHNKERGHVKGSPEGFLMWGQPIALGHFHSAMELGQLTVNGAAPGPQHYESMPLSGATHSCTLIYPDGTTSQIHPKFDGTLTREQIYWQEPVKLHWY